MVYESQKWVAWFDADEEGFIRDAGVDVEDRSSNVCVTTTENVEIEDKDEFNKYVKRDTLLIAAAPELYETLAALTDWAREHTSPLQPNSPHALLVAAVIALNKATGDTYAPASR